MSDAHRSRFFLAEAIPYLEQLKPENRRNLGTFYLAYIDGCSYAITFKFTDKWEINTCIKWMR